MQFTLENPERVLELLFRQRAKQSSKPARTAYTGAQLREIRRFHGVGRPPHVNLARAKAQKSA